MKNRFGLAPFLFKTTFLCIAIACASTLFGQSLHLRFEHITTRDGLSQSNVLCAMQDSRGFMWFGTRDGLNRYDGYEFKVYKNDPQNLQSLSNNYVLSVFESRDGSIYIATRGGGLCSFDRKTERFTRYLHDPTNAASISSNAVTYVFEDSKGILWVATEKGLNQFDKVGKTFTCYRHDKNNPTSLGDDFVKTVFEDFRGNLWVGTSSGGLNLFNRQTKTFGRFEHNYKDPHSISYNGVYKIFEDSKKRLWIGTSGGGLNLFDPVNGKFAVYPSKVSTWNLRSRTIFAINEDDEGNIWVGTENGGLSVFNLEKNTFYNYQHDEIDEKSICNNSIYVIYKDAKKNFWLGTFNSGISVMNRDAALFTHHKRMLQSNSLSNNHVLSIYEDSKKNIWIGTDGGGLNRYNPATGQFVHFKHEEGNPNSLCGNHVLTVCEDSEGNIWAGTWDKGISVFNPETKRFRHFKNNPANPSSLSSNNAWKIFRDSANNIWVGTYGAGLNLYLPKEGSFAHFANEKTLLDVPGSKLVHSIHEDKNGKLWLSTDGGGIVEFDKKTQRFKQFLHDDKKNSLSSNGVHSIYEDKEQNFWIATANGLNFFNRKTGKFTNYTMADGMPNNVVFGIVEDEQGFLWVSTNKGLSRFDRKAKQFQNFDLYDGLQSHEFSRQAFCKSSDGILYFGGNNGFNVFNPLKIKPVQYDPGVVVTGFKIMSKEVRIANGDKDASPLLQSITESRELTLPYNHSEFTFQFASLNYTAPEKKQYAYMLQGFDKDWNYAGTKRTATYTNLSPGSYVFKVKGLTNDGKWSERITSVKIVIRPPFWLTWWFKLFVVIAGVGAVLALLKLRTRNITRQRRKLQELVDKQTEQLRRSNEEEHRARLQIDEANKELQRKNNELEQFAYVASHDLQEPLRTISSFVGLLQQQYKDKLDERSDKYINYIVHAADRMKVLITDLLEYSRIGKKKESAVVDCNKLVGEVVSDLQVAIEEARAEVTAGLLPVLSAYPTEMKQIIQNLITNAIKFRKKDVAPKIEITSTRVNGHWQFSIKDNGIGIDPKYSERIFVIFQRLHTRSEYEGSGIGLSNCRKIAELHGGKIWVESTPGEGCNFLFTVKEQMN